MFLPVEGSHAGGEILDEYIEIPNGRRIYALLVSGFHQNRNLNMFHFYNFAKFVLKKKGYVHFSWWNNLLAPYMRRPLHDDNSVPSNGEIPWLDLMGDECYPDKAIPGDDYQFQADAKRLLTAIRDHNPLAKIVLVGHSMGGDAVARLGVWASEENIALDIALLAPIDPVGNRSWLIWPDGGDLGNARCSGLFNFTRYQATHEDWWEGSDPFLNHAPRREFGTNIKYLYHRWQQEALPPFDFLCPPFGLFCSHMYESDYLFKYDHDIRVSRIGQGSTNVQSKMPTSLFSGLVVWPWFSLCPNCGGFIDGHGEIVGFRGVEPFGVNSYPVALEAGENWPPWPGSECERECHMRKWEVDPEYLDNNDYAPKSPNLCKVSGDLEKILATIPESEPPEADAKGPYESECEGTTTIVSLDGTGSSDPDSPNLTYFWHTNCPGGSFDDPDSATPELTVDTSNGCKVDCIVELTVTDELGNEDIEPADVSINDTVSPDISCPANKTVECDESTDPSHTGEATATDACDPEPDVTFTDVNTPSLCPEKYTITRTWAVTDYCENTSSCVQTIEVVDTTAPVISCNVGDATITPPDAPISFMATATDNCDGDPSIEITEFDCFKFTKKGKRIDKTESCVVDVSGDTITILDSGGVADNIKWTVNATDGCGNVAVSECAVVVVNPGNKP